MPPHPTSRKPILLLSSHLCLGLPSGLFPSGFPTKTLCAPFLPPIRAIWPAHLDRTKYWEKNLSQCQFVHHKSHMDWPEMEPGLTRWQAGNWPTEPRSGQQIIPGFKSDRQVLLLLPLALQPALVFGLSNNTSPFVPIYHQLSPSSHSQHLKISFHFFSPSFPETVRYSGVKLCHRFW